MNDIRWEERYFRKVVHSFERPIYIFPYLGDKCSTTSCQQLLDAGEFWNLLHLLLTGHVYPIVETLSWRQQCHTCPTPTVSGFLRRDVWPAEVQTHRWSFWIDSSQTSEVLLLTYTLKCTWTIHLVPDEKLVLFHIPIHDSFLACDLLNFWEADLFLAVLMPTVIHLLNPWSDCQFQALTGSISPRKRSIVTGPEYLLPPWHTELGGRLNWGIWSTCYVHLPLGNTESAPELVEPKLLTSVCNINCIFACSRLGNFGSWYQTEKLIYPRLNHDGCEEIEIVVGGHSSKLDLLSCEGPEPVQLNVRLLSSRPEKTEVDLRSGDDELHQNENW